jgi:hypothetical protein
MATSRRGRLVRLTVLVLLLGTACTHEPSDGSASLASSLTTAQGAVSSIAAPPIAPVSSSAATTALELPFDGHREALLAVAKDFERLGASVPALREFDAERDVDLEWLRITYSYKAPWVSVPVGIKTERRPVPEADGLWLYIDFHERVEEGERNTQVFRGHYRHLGRRVLVVLKTGEHAHAVRDALWRVLAKHDTVDLGLQKTPTQ